MQRVELAKHSRLWKWKFRKEKALLRAFLRGDILDIEHVGSTAVPDMIAKPIIDLVATVSNFELAFDYVHKIEKIGYEYKGENAELRQYFFVKGTPAAYHLYVQERFADVFGRIAFRDCLMRNSEIAFRYAELKRTLAASDSVDIRTYQEGKRGFIDEVLRTAVTVA